MFGKHYETRPHEHLIHVYSRVPYLDSQIFNIEAQGLRESRKSINRTSKALQGIERTQKLSERLSEGLRSSRKRVEEEDNKFLDELKVSQNNCLERSRVTLKNWAEEQKQSRLEHIKDQKYLDDLLSTNATKAASRLSSVRRWH